MEIKLNIYLFYILKPFLSRTPWTSDLRNGTIVPYVAFVWENIGDVSQFALLHVLFYWV